MPTEQNANQTVAAGATPGSPARCVKTPAERVLPPLVYRLPAVESVQGLSGLKYSEVEDPNLLVDV